MSDRITEIRSRATAYAEYGTPGLAAPKDRADLLAAIDGVLNLHKMAHTDVEPWAAGYRYSGDHCSHDGEHWPCATIEALEAKP